MKAKDILRPAVIIVTLIILLSFMGNGCFPRPIEERAVLPELVWPPFPEKPRIRFITSLTREIDIGIKSSAFRRILNLFTGKIDNAMVKPYGVNVDVSGRLYVIDSALRTVHVYDKRANTYYTLNTKEDPFTSPIDIAIDDRRGYVYISDSAQKVIKIFDIESKSYVGELGRDILERPTGIAINKKKSEILVVDTLSSNILRFNLENNEFIGAFGGTGSGKGRLHYPTNIYTKEDGTILVSDSLNFRIQIFSPAGEFVRMFGSEGDKPGYFTRPRGVAVDSDGNIYVVDALFDNVQLFDPDGRLLMAFGNHGTENGEFWLPSGIFIDENDRIYVSDTYNKRVQIFQYLKNEGAYQ